MVATVVAHVATAVACAKAPPLPPPPDGMVAIPAGPVAAFHLDRTEVTNAAFAQFVAATGYRTQAERPVDWEQLRRELPPGTPRPSDAALAPGSLVFTPTPGAVPLDDERQWWRWTAGANWQHPEGPTSDLAGRETHPVVHVTHADAEAFCAWAGKRLPTDAEWEHAARGGLEGQRYSWGDAPITPALANTWQGAFPVRDAGEDGYAGTAPVGRFPANGYGLLDLAGNVWEWTASAAAPDQRVIRGGSFLCHASYCEGYRVAARMQATPTTSLQHTGFRCAVTPDAAPTSPAGAAPAGRP
jgi:formylglycine-generating enzyme required for sulfatase activity